MKYKIFSSIMCAGLVTMVCLNSNAQKPRAKQVNNNRQDTTKKAAGASDYFSTPGNGGGGGGTAGQQPGNGRPDTSRKPVGGVPLVVVPASGNDPLNGAIAPSMRQEDAFNRNLIKERAPLEYQNIREDDAVYMERVWRVIDTREKINLSFRNPTEENGNSEMFLSILYKAATDSLGGNPVMAFRDERFSQPYKVNEFIGKFSGGVDTVDVKDLQGQTIRKEIRAREFKMDSVYQYEIKEEWIFDKETSRMYVRIIGIAPMMIPTSSDGTALTKAPIPLFWMYYPDLRPVLAKRDVYNGKNYGARMSWEELFEGRMFNSFIVKSTLDNPFNQSLAEQYPSNTLFRLLQGDHIKDKIFDYEQSLWQY